MLFFRNWTILKIWKFLEFSNMEVFGFFQIGIFWNFSNCKIFELSQLENVGISEIGYFRNFPNCKILNIPNWHFFEYSNFWKINKFLEFFEFRKPTFDLKNWQFWNLHLRNWIISYIWLFYEFVNNGNLGIFWNFPIWQFCVFSNLENVGTWN